MRRRRRAVVLASMALVAGCGGSNDTDGSGEAGAESEVGGVEPEHREGGDEAPAASGGADVRPYVEALLADHDAAVDEITADPDLARDADGEAVRRYVELYEPDSVRPAQVLDAWAQMAAAGQRVQPLDPEAPPTVLDLDGEIEVVSADEVRFPLCVRQQMQVVGPDGRPTEEPTTTQLPGEGVAVRIEGRWRIRELATFDEGACHIVVVAGEQEGGS